MIRCQLIWYLKQNKGKVHKGSTWDKIKFCHWLPSNSVYSKSQHRTNSVVLQANNYEYLCTSVCLAKEKKPSFSVSTDYKGMSASLCSSEMTYRKERKQINADRGGKQDISMEVTSSLEANIEHEHFQLCLRC